jgi:NAD(P)-dependent dehydrogenase (short-subunit alcohol dehydrogenase family)
VAIAYLSEQEDEDAARTAELVGQAGRRCVTIRGDLAEEGNCDRAVERTVAELGGLDLLVNNVATQGPVDDLTKLSTEQWDRTFRVNIYSYFWTTRAALRHLPDGGVIINTASINGLRGNKSLIDYAATKGAVLALTYSLAHALQDRGIRVNSVAPGAGLDAADPRHFPGGEGRRVRQPGTDGPGGASGRDRPVLRLLRQRPAVQLLLGRGTGAHRRRNAARLIPANDPAGAGQKGSPWRYGGSGRFLTWSGTEPNSPCSSP